MNGKFTKLAHILITKKDIFSNEKNYNRVFDKIINTVMDQKNWALDTKITFICNKHNVPDTYKVVAATKNDKIYKNEWYIGPTFSKQELEKNTLSCTFELTHFLQDCVKKIEAQNEIG
jgi:hypothetical protein